MEKDFWELTNNEVYEYFGIDPQVNGEEKFKAAQAIQDGNEYPPQYIRHLLNIAESEAQLYIAGIKPSATDEKPKDEKEPIFFSVRVPSLILGLDDLQTLADELNNEDIDRKKVISIFRGWIKEKPYIYLPPDAIGKK